MRQGFCKPNCSVADNVRALSCFNALLKTYSRIQVTNEAEAHLQAAADMLAPPLMPAASPSKRG